MNDLSSVGIELVVIAPYLEPVIFIIGLQKLRSEVDVDLLLIKIREAQVEIHIKRLVAVARFPEQEIQRINIHAREKHLAVDMSYVRENERDTPVLLAVVKVHNELGVRQKVRIDARISDRTHNGKGHFILFNNKFFYLDLVFHKNTSV